MIISPRCCKSCGQPLRAMRLDVWFPAIKARIIDAVNFAGEVGITNREIRSTAYPPGEHRSPFGIRSHIWQINEELALENSDWRIVAQGRGPHARWFLRRRARVKKAA